MSAYHRRALLIGIDKYDNVPSLKGCVNDAKSMQEMLSRNEDKSINYNCKLLTSPGPLPITRKELRNQWKQLFSNFRGEALFYFSGHGTPTDVGGYLVTQDGEEDDPGLAMNDLLTLANDSDASSITLILDCCYSGAIGSPANLRSDSISHVQLREGVTILAASGVNEEAIEVGGHGVFTSLVIGALGGGASDIRGNVSAASIYAYVEQALGPWDQRPMYKSHADRLSPIRKCNPHVTDDLLRELPDIFTNYDSPYKLNPSYEHTDDSAIAENVAMFNKFKILRNARLLYVDDDLDLYYAALGSRSVSLTPIGQFYCGLAANNLI